MSEGNAVQDNDVDLREPSKPEVEHYPPCGLGGCKRGATYRVSVLLYPRTPTLAAPTYKDFGARVIIGHACKKHRGNWTVASFLNSGAWRYSNNADRFYSEFRCDPDPSLAVLEVVRT